MNEDWLSAHLDGELSESERLELDAALDEDGELARTYNEIARVRALLRGDAVDMPDGVLERMIDTVSEGGTDAGASPGAAVIPLASRRRVPTFAAAAAAMVIIASVVGGLGGSTTLPALGDLIEQHEAAAAVVDDGSMPSDMDHMDPMPMDEAESVGLPMPTDFSMQHAFADGGTIHLIYRTGRGDAVSVFRHEGDADMDELGDGSMVSGPEADMWSAPMHDTYVAVVDGDGYVWVIIGADPGGEMMDDVMHDLPSRSPSMGERLRDAADAAVEPFRLWG